MTYETVKLETIDGKNPKIDGKELGKVRSCHVVDNIFIKFDLKNTYEAFVLTYYIYKFI